MSIQFVTVDPVKPGCDDEGCGLCNPEAMALFYVQSAPTSFSHLVDAYESQFGREAMQQAILLAVAQGLLEPSLEGLLYLTPKGELRIAQRGRLEESGLTSA